MAECYATHSIKPVSWWHNLRSKRSCGLAAVRQALQHSMAECHATHSITHVCSALAARCADVRMLLNVLPSLPCRQTQLHPMLPQLPYGVLAGGLLTDKYLGAKVDR